ncbi:hypothetical protein FRACYDRAFT_260014 [Fragilariopsis cylindrus CCMP1102]|uniref:Uncharacterized protein n=1 Tax=Fragilariopsis cylindrus CCMP1102 TaxID=635003 RepID=A0A1E7FMX5_9STRA|nr:hypothetical protein FRACYDRAFT_260014 [Fragilariopsis cylindrus CCMP1102]|eukprot:OEU19487.1 hypothetical protein FRACYDRAFT_260014 [Fragilariopsis cylindrus CCMP1102]
MSSTSIPEVVGISGCDDTLWNSIPYGAQRDLERFCRLATDESYEFVQTKEFPISPLELAKNRVDTMKDINRFVVKKNKKKKNENDDADDADDASPFVPPFEDLAWNNGVKSWELNNLAEKEMALAKVKADKKAAIKLMREEEEAAKVEAAAKLAEEVEAEAEMADGMENDDDDGAFQ